MFMDFKTATNYLFSKCIMFEGRHFSLFKSVKSKEFARIRIGISPKKKPQGEEKVVNFLLKGFKPDEISELKKMSKKVEQAIVVMLDEGLPKAMSLFN